MPRGRKPVKKKSTASRSNKTRSSLQIAREKLREAVSRAREIKKELTNKLKTHSAEFKNKLKEAEVNAFKKAMLTLGRETTKREDSKKKALAAAEAKFEKKYSKKQAKKNNSKPKNKAAKNVRAENSVKVKHKAVGRKSSKKRGRPSKKVS